VVGYDVGVEVDWGEEGVWWTCLGEGLGFGDAGVEPLLYDFYCFIDRSRMVGCGDVSQAETMSEN
jgi:hypothetical protein